MRIHRIPHTYIQLVSFNHQRHSFIYTDTDYMYTTLFPLALLSPLASCFLLFSFCPIRPLLLTWNPPCCDRIRPPCPQVARKLTLPFPSPGSYTPHSKIPTPPSFPTPNIHSLGQQCESSSQDRAQHLQTEHVHVFTSRVQEKMCSKNIVAQCTVTSTV